MIPVDFKEFRLETSGDALMQEMDGEAVILDLSSESYFGLNTAAVDFWNAFQEHSHLESAFRYLVDKYDVDEQLLREDLQEFIQELLSRGLARLEPV